MPPSDVKSSPATLGPWPRQYDRYFKPRGERPASPSLRPLADARKTATLDSTLDECTDLLTPAMARHLLRRTGFGVSSETVNAIVGRPANEVVDEIVDEAIASPEPVAPHWANAFLPPNGSPDSVFDQYFEDNGRWGFEYVHAWMKRLIPGGLREKLSVFWHNHFVTEIDVYFFAPIAYRYGKLMREHAMGNFKDFVHAVGLDQAMLVYLDGRSNVWFEPNENYARELLELFTMGQYDQNGNANYTQEDIVNLSRALTGWILDYSDFSVHFIEQRHDILSKTIFEHRANLGYDSSIDVIFDKRAAQIGEFMSRKFYHFFVHDDDDPTITDSLAADFVENGFEIAPVIRRLLKSKRFFDPAIYGTKLKSPLEMMIGMMQESGRDDFTDDSYWAVLWMGNDLGQRLLQPPNVAGWPGYRSWITTSTLPSRWEMTSDLINYNLLGHGVSFAPAIEHLGDHNDPLYVFQFPTLLAEHLLAVPLEELSYEATTGGFAGDLVSNPLPVEIEEGPAYVRELAILFLGSTPWYEWSLHSGGSGLRIARFISLLMELPEYQLA